MALQSKMSTFVVQSVDCVKRSARGLQCSSTAVIGVRPKASSQIPGARTVEE